MDGQTTYLDEFNATAPDLSREVNVIVAKTPETPTIELTELNVTKNGIYTPEEGYAGFNKVNVDVLTYDIDCEIERPKIEFISAEVLSN